MGSPVTEEEPDRDLKGCWVAHSSPKSILQGAVQGCLPYASLGLAHSKRWWCVPGTHGPPSLPSHQDHSTSQEGGFRQKISPNVIFSFPVSV